MTKPGILRQALVLFASNLPDTIAYRRDKLGFAQHGVFGEPPQFAIMEYGKPSPCSNRRPRGTRSLRTGR